MKKYEYMVTSIVIKKADEMTKVLFDKFNQYGYDGWELVQWQLCPEPLNTTSSTQSTKKSLNILATWKRELHE